MKHIAVEFILGIERLQEWHTRAPTSFLMDSLTRASRLARGSVSLPASLWQCHTCRNPYPKNFSA
jgi:hypothetical protein